MPDGTQVQFPDDMPSEQIKGLIASKFPDVAKSEQEKQQTGFGAITQPISDFIDAQRERGAKLNNIVNATQQGQQSIPEGIFQGAMNEVGAVAQVPTTAVQMAGKILTEGAPEPVQNTISSIGQKLAPIAQAYQENQQAYNEANPRAGRNLEAVREIGNLLPFSPEVRAVASTGTELTGQALKGTGETIAKGITKTAEALKPETMFTSDAIKQLASDAYKTANEQGGTLTPTFANKLFDSVDAMKPQTEHGIATVGENALAKLSDDWKTLRGKPISLQAAQEMDEGLSQRIDSHVDRMTGKLDKEGRQLYDVQTQFRDMIDKVSPEDIIGGKEGFDALKEGRNYWSTALRIGDMERILTRASMTDNPATSIKAGFRTLYNNPARMRGYNGAERAAIKRAAQSGVISGTLRTVLGSRLIGTAMGTALGTAGGGFIGGAAGAGVGAGQAAVARAIAAKLQKGRANKVIKTISRRVQ